MTDDRRATRWRAPDEPCLNCGDTTPGRFCPTCGQRKAEVLVSVRTMLQDVLEDQLVLNRALPRTIRALLFQPGFLTAEYIRGRIVRYIAPFRLYLVSSVLFFLILSFIGVRTIDIEINTDGEPLPANSVVVADPLSVDDGTSQDTIALRDTVSGIDVGAPDTGAPLPVGTRQPWAQGIEFDNPSLFERAIMRKVGQVGHLPVRDAMRRLMSDLLEYAPHMLFIMLPLYALLLKLLYIRRNRYYAEHFVFALHVHAFLFTTFIVMILLPDQLDMLFGLWIAIYVWLAMKRVYAQGYARTTIKWLVLGVSYSFMLMFGLVGLMIVTLLLT